MRRDIAQEFRDLMAEEAIPSQRTRVLAAVGKISFTVTVTCKGCLTTWPFTYNGLTSLDEVQWLTAQVYRNAACPHCARNCRTNHQFHDQYPEMCLWGKKLWNGIKHD